jgi:hypothetical protein
MWDFTKHPVDFLHDLTTPTDAKTDPDLTAFKAGETLRVACWLRGEDPSLPQKFVQGVLLIGPDGMSWHHWLRHKHRLIPIPPVDRVQEVISPASQSTGEKTSVGQFSNVVTSGPSGKVEFVVPGVGPALIRAVIDHKDTL